MRREATATIIQYIYKKRRELPSLLLRGVEENRKRYAEKFCLLKIKSEWYGFQKFTDRENKRFRLLFLW